MNFYIGDLYIAHNRILMRDKRPFSSIEEMGWIYSHFIKYQMVLL